MLPSSVRRRRRRRLLLGAAALLALLSCLGFQHVRTLLRDSIGGGASPPKMRLAAHRTASGRYVRWEPADEADRHTRFHHQRYEPLPTAAEEHRRLQRRRGLVESVYPILGDHTIGYDADDPSGVLTDATTSPISIHIDFSSLYPADDPNLPAGLSPAVPYAVCFAVGDWFKWGQPATAAPPCADPALPADRSHTGWLNSGVEPCPGAAAGAICDRSQDPTMYSQQGCWGVCIEEDVLETTPSPGCAAAGFGDDVCNMREYYMSKVRGVVAEFEPFLRVRSRTGLLQLTPSTQGCAHFARNSYNLPVGDHYCTAGIDADAIFFPTYTQYVPGVAGWGTEAGKDQYGRPLLILMGLVVNRDYRQRCIWDARSLIMHELVRFLSFLWSLFRSF